MAVLPGRGRKKVAVISRGDRITAVAVRRGSTVFKGLQVKREANSVFHHLMKYNIVKCMWGTCSPHHQVY